MDVGIARRAKYFCLCCSYSLFISRSKILITCLQVGSNGLQARPYVWCKHLVSLLQQPFPQTYIVVDLLADFYLELLPIDTVSEYVHASRGIDGASHLFQQRPQGDLLDGFVRDCEIGVRDSGYGFLARLIFLIVACLGVSPERDRRFNLGLAIRKHSDRDYHNSLSLFASTYLWFSAQVLD